MLIAIALRILSKFLFETGSALIEHVRFDFNGSTILYY